MASTGLSDAYAGDWKRHLGDVISMEVFVIRKADDGESHRGCPRF